MISFNYLAISFSYSKSYSSDIHNGKRLFERPLEKGTQITLLVYNRTREKKASLIKFGRTGARAGVSDLTKIHIFYQYC